MVGILAPSGILYHVLRFSLLESVTIDRRKDSQSARRSSMSSENSDEDSIASSDDNVTFTCFESSVCYAFITKVLFTIF